MATVATINTLDAAITTHPDVTPMAFWTEARKSWHDLADFYRFTGDVGSEDFFREMEAAAWFMMTSTGQPMAVSTLA
jgi:hypothetical protein